MSSSGSEAASQVQSRADGKVARVVRDHVTVVVWVGGGGRAWHASERSEGQVLGQYEYIAEGLPKGKSAS